MTPNIINLLIELASTGADATRAAALYALGEGAPPTDDVISTLTRATSFGSIATREAAIKALGRIHRRR